MLACGPLLPRESHWSDRHWIMYHSLNKLSELMNNTKCKPRSFSKPIMSTWHGYALQVQQPLKCEAKGMHTQQTSLLWNLKRVGKHTWSIVFVQRRTRMAVNRPSSPAHSTSTRPYMQSICPRKKVESYFNSQSQVAGSRCSLMTMQVLLTLFAKPAIEPMLRVGRARTNGQAKLLYPLRKTWLCSWSPMSSTLGSRERTFVGEKSEGTVRPWSWMACWEWSSWFGSCSSLLPEPKSSRRLA